MSIMNNADYKKQKAGKSFPGDVPRWAKIRMIEGKDSAIHYGGDIYQVILAKSARTYRKIVNDRKNKRFRQRSKAEINRIIIEDYD